MNLKIYQISPDAFHKIKSMENVYLENDDIDFELAFSHRDNYYVSNGVAFIHVYGPLKRNASPIDLMVGFTDYQQIIDELLEAENDLNVESVILNIDSPGGEAIGSDEVCELLTSYSKPVIASVFGGQCLSAAYKLASACTLIMASTSSEIGSIGSIITLTNSKEIMNSQGVYMDIWTNEGAVYKSIGADFGSTNDLQKEFIQEKVNEVGMRFQKIVLVNRPNINTEVFSAAYYSAEKALEFGLIDQIITLNKI